MKNEQTNTSQIAQTIDRDDQQAVKEWADRFDVSPAQIHDAVNRVGPVAADVEMHLKGSRSVTNEQRVDAAEDVDTKGSN